MNKPAGEIQVIIFGAGIAGLTAAHELVERGFRVRLVERDDAPEQPLRNGKETVAVGGVARTQWGQLISDGELAIAPTGGKPLGTVSAETLQMGFVGCTAEDFNPDEQAELEANVAARLKDHPGCAFTISGYAKPTAAAPDWKAEGIARATKMQKVLQAKFGEHFSILPAQVEGDGHDGVEAWVQSFPVPGEHGFRFFPSFYRHLFDTLRRIPIPVAPSAAGEDLTPGGERQEGETGGCVYENLLPTNHIEVSMGDSKRSFMVARTLPRSVSAVMDLLRHALGSLGCTLNDVAKMELKIFQYLSSCPARRREYERMSWYQFVDADSCSPSLRKYLQTSSQALLALRGSEGDARTHGNILVQLMLDQLDPNAHADATLNGPTSVAWFDHWRRYLESQHVQFDRGSLDGFHADRRGAIHPVVVDADGKPLKGFDDPDAYYILAVDVTSARRLADAWVDAVPDAPPDDDFRKLIQWLPPGWDADLENRDAKGPLRHMSGVQLFFDTELFFPRAHTIYLDTAWGLTSIGQPAFWGRRAIPRDQFRGLLSVDISDWVTPFNGVSAWDSSDLEVVMHTWEQLRKAHGLTTLDANLPRYYHLDRYIARSDSMQKGKRVNRAPFLIAMPGEYQKRPGNLQGYACHAGRWFLAGNYLQTATRLSSMEAPNESARRAVNALLKEVHFHGVQCDIFDPEKYELDDLEPLRTLDEKLLAAGVPHFLEILELQRLPDIILPPGPPMEAPHATD